MKNTLIFTKGCDRSKIFREMMYIFIFFIILGIATIINYNIIINETYIQKESTRYTTLSYINYFNSYMHGIVKNVELLGVNSVEHNHIREDIESFIEVYPEVSNVCIQCGNEQIIFDEKDEEIAWIINNKIDVSKITSDLEANIGLYKGEDGLHKAIISKDIFISDGNVIGKIYAVVDYSKIISDMLKIYKNAGRNIHALNVAVSTESGMQEIYSYMKENINNPVTVDVKSVTQELIVDISLPDRWYSLRKLAARDIVITILSLLITLILRRLIEDIVATKREKKINIEKAKYLSKVMYEIRTCCSSIIGISDILLNGKNEVGTKDSVISIKETAEYLMGSVSNIFELETIESGRFKTSENGYYVQFLIDEVLGEAKTAVGQKKVTIMTEIQNDLPLSVLGDEKNLSKAIGMIFQKSVSSLREGYIKFIVLSDRLENNTIKLSIKIVDNGMGLKEEQLENVFDAYREIEEKTSDIMDQTKNLIPIAKKIVNILGGELYITSEYGKGTVYKLEIVQKIIDGRRMTKGIKEELIPQESKKNEIIKKAATAIVVDDNEVNLRVIAGILKNYGITAECFTDGRTAVAELNSKKYDMIFIDYIMPDFDGIDTLNAIRSSDNVEVSLTPAIMLTADSTITHNDKVQKAGFDAIITKPIQISGLEDLLSKILLDK